VPRPGFECIPLTDRGRCRVVARIGRHRQGNRDEAVAYNVRLRVEQDGMLSRAPTPGELEFLTYLRKDEGYGQRNRIVR
jgi:hypothetical protein